MDVDEENSCAVYLPYTEPTSCGYCKDENGAKQYGLWTFSLTPEDYQALLDRGWRRCGNYCYKPMLSESCCSLYTIKCDALQFKATRSQRKIMKRMNQFLQTGEKANLKGGARAIGVGNSEIANASKEICHQLKKPSLQDSSEILKKIPKASRKRTPKLCEDSKSVITGARLSEPSRSRNPMKAKQLRINRKLEKLKALGLSEEDIQKRMVEKKRYPKVKEIEDFIDVVKEDSAAHKLEIRIVKASPRSVEFERSSKETYNLFVLYQTKVHNDRPGKNSQHGYERFLVESPIIDSEIYGSHHMQYWLDGKLIAVGVLDLLPACVSSVYLYYHPDYAFLNLGTYGALREIAYVRSLAKSKPELSSYYMGFYIHSCPKMRYKGAFRPSYLLCPEKYTWHPIADCLPKIEKFKYSKFNEDPRAVDEENDPTVEVPVVHQRKIVLSSSLPRKMTAEKQLIAEYISTVGKTCAQRMILQLQ